jgi:elongation factor 1-beta
VTIYKALSGAPDSAKYPNAARWYKNINSYETEFETLPGEQSTDISKYGPETVENTVDPAAAPAAEEEDDEDVDLFGSDDEEEDAEKEALAAKRLEEYRAKKALKPKTSMFCRFVGW